MSRGLLLAVLFLQTEASAAPDYKQNLWNLFSFRHSHSPPAPRPTCQEAPEVEVLGLMSWLLFSSLILMVGVWAGWSQRWKQKSPELIILADRKLDFCVGALSLAATCAAGGATIGMGAAQAVFSQGLLWSLAPVFYSLSLAVGGLLFANKMRSAKYFTMMDPFTMKFGLWGSVLVIPAVLSEVIWCAAILSSLGSALHIILQLDQTFSIVISAGLALAYTMLGGLLSVAYTDVVRVIFIIFGLFLALPFTISHPAVSSLTADESPLWWGTVSSHQAGAWLDISLLCLLGGIPWQSYFQRVLSAQSASQAVLLSCGGASLALVVSLPSLLLGAVAASTDWSQVDPTGCVEAPHGAKYVLAFCLKYLTPPHVSLIGVGVVTAAMMTSADSSLLSASSLVARNFYQRLVRPGCGEREVMTVLWVAIIISCLASTGLALHYTRVHELYVLCGDLTYVLLFPQLLLVLYLPQANTYGSLSSFLVSLTLRLLTGDLEYLGLTQHFSFGVITASCPSLHDPALLCSGELPYRTIIMLIGLLVHISLSYLTHFLFCAAHLPLNLDVLGSFQKVDEEGNVGARKTRYLDGPVENLKDSLYTQYKYLKKFEKQKQNVLNM